MTKQEKLIDTPDILKLGFAKASIPIAAARAAEAVKNRFRYIQHREDLTEQQWRCLRLLFDIGPLSLTELGKLSCIHKVSMSRIVPSLEAKGWTTRRADPNDKRASIVELTDDGRKRLEPIVAEAKEIAAQIVEEFGQTKYYALLGLLDDMAKMGD